MFLNCSPDARRFVERIGNCKCKIGKFFGFHHFRLTKTALLLVGHSGPYLKAVMQDSISMLLRVKKLNYNFKLDRCCCFWASDSDRILCNWFRWSLFRPNWRTGRIKSKFATVLWATDRSQSGWNLMSRQESMSSTNLMSQTYLPGHCSSFR